MRAQILRCETQSQPAPTAPAVAPVACLDPYHDFEIGRWLVTAWAGPAIVRWAVREERGQIYCAPEVLETTNRYNENDGVSKRVLELAFRIVTWRRLGANLTVRTCCEPNLRFAAVTAFAPGARGERCDRDSLSFGKQRSSARPAAAGVAVLMMDASNIIMIAVAAILSQPDDEGHQHPVACESRKLTAAEQN